VHGLLPHDRLDLPRTLGLELLEDGFLPILRFLGHGTQGFE
jgi:hypothetical protein